MPAVGSAPWSGGPVGSVVVGAPARPGAAAGDREQPHWTTRPVTEIRRLNTLRGVAALIVLVSHFSNETGLGGGVFGEGAGQIGVMLFFVLSGFLMSHLYLEREPSAANLRSYFVARAARVLPLYLLVVAVSFLACAWLPPSVARVAYEIDSTRYLASHLLLLRGESVLWTIAPEIQFYGLFAVAWVARGRVRTLLGYGAVVALLVQALWGFGTKSFTLSGLPATLTILKALPYFVAGALLGRLYAVRHRFEGLARGGHLWAFLLLFLMYPNVFERVTGQEHRMWGDLRLLLVVTGVFFLVVFLVPAKSAILENPVGDFLGQISFSLYLLHLPVLRTLESLDLAESTAGLLLFLSTSLAVSFLCFRFVESPSRRFVRRRLLRESAG